MTTLASLLGFPAPLLSPTAPHKRLSSNELRVAIAAFHRARGHQHTLTFPRFCNSILQESFPAMPRQLAQRIFCVWNCNETLELTLNEFLIGVTVILKGTREEHLKFVYQVMDTTNTQELAKKDTLAFLKAIFHEGGIVATESGSNKVWTVSDLAELLHPSPFDMLTQQQFVKILNSRAFETFSLLDWIPAFATQFYGVEKIPHETQTTRYNANSTSECCTTLTSDTFIRPLNLTPNTLAIIQQELWSLLDFIANTGESVPFTILLQRFQGIIPQEILCVVKELSENGIPGTFGHTDDASLEEQSQLICFMLAVCCGYASTVDDIYRLLFTTFDSDNRGYLDTDQLATFLRFAKHISQHESERIAMAMLRHTIDPSLSSPPSSPISTTATHQHRRDSELLSLSYGQFVSLVQNNESAFCGLLLPTTLEMLLSVFHICRCQLNSHFDNATSLTLAQILKIHGQQKHQEQYQPTKSISSQDGIGFCLLKRIEWWDIVEQIHGGSTYDHALEDTWARSISRETNSGSGITNNNQEHQVLIPLSLWTIISFWYRHYIRTKPAKQWSQLVGCVNIDQNQQNGAILTKRLAFRGYCIALSLQMHACDGTERNIAIPCVIASELMSVQNVVDAVMLQQQWLPTQNTNNVIGAVKTFCECQLRFSSDNVITVSHELLIVQLEALLPKFCPQITDVNSTRNFELHATVVEIVSEEKRDQKTAKSNSSRCVNDWSGSSSPSPRSRQLSSSAWNNIHGLANLGNTCFMNSALQCLVVTPLLREYFLSQEFLFDLSSSYHSAPLNGSMVSPKINLTTIKNNDKNRSQRKDSAQAGDLPLAFGQFMAQMNAYAYSDSFCGVSDVIFPQQLQHVIANHFPDLSDGNQQDAQEFLSSLLSALSNALKRRPHIREQSGYGEEDTTSSTLLSPQSRAFLSRLSAFAYKSEDRAIDQVDLHNQEKLYVPVHDSNGRHDSIVAMEWWIAHLVNEPSFITALFSGQYKSVLTCDVCGTKSARFEPFLSLQVPLLNNEEYHTSMRDNDQYLDVIVIVHFMNSQQPSLRIAIRAAMDWTLEQLFTKLSQNYCSSLRENKTKYVAVLIEGHIIQEILDDDTLLMTIPLPIEVFELANIEINDRQLPPHSGVAFTVGENVFAWISKDRLVKAQVTAVHYRHNSHLHHGYSQTSSSASGSLTTYDLVLTESISIGRSLRDISCIEHIFPNQFGRRVLYLRFLHCRRVLVPFYCSTPYRYMLCGVPFVLCVDSYTVTGNELYCAVRRRCVGLRSLMNAPPQGTPAAFLLRRVRDDGKCCKRCHWMTKCRGCVIPWSNDKILDLEMDETIAIDWEQDNQENQLPKADKNNQVFIDSIEDDVTYIQYRKANALSLEKSLAMLFCKEQLEAHCVRCQTNAKLSESGVIKTEMKENKSASSSLFLTPHTKELSLWSVPPVLIIQLKRFEFAVSNSDTIGSSNGCIWRKVTRCVDFRIGPDSPLDLQPFLGTIDGIHDDGVACSERCEKAVDDKVRKGMVFLQQELQFPLRTASRKHTQYSLYAIVNHRGEISSGHYTAHIKDPENHEWWLVDDSTVSRVSPSQVQQQLTPSSSAYLLFYVRNDINNTEPMEDGTEEHGDGSNNHLQAFFPRQSHATKYADTRETVASDDDITCSKETSSYQGTINGSTLKSDHSRKSGQHMSTEKYGSNCCLM